MLREDLLHYLWRTRQFDTHALTTTDGESIEILHFGEYNPNAGADFLNARVRINGVLWAGSVEMHVRTSDWQAHQHSRNAAYNNVILHVVYEQDIAILRPQLATLENGNDADENTEKLPCLELKTRIGEEIVKKYWALLNNEHWIPCQHHFHKVNAFVRNQFAERLLAERLLDKAQNIAQALVRNKNDWNETFYQALARNFGVKINAEPMEWLARATPYLTLEKHRNQLPQVEALIFGQAGMLEDEFHEGYPRALQQEYRFLKHKHHLEAIPLVSWKFARLRPNNFPTIRLAQLAMLFHRNTHLFSRVLDIQTLDDVSRIFDVQPSAYWRTHYRFDTPSVEISKSLGQDTIQLIAINTVVPFQYLYAEMNNDFSLRDRALALLEAIPAEKNNLTDGWQKLGVTFQNAYESQAFIQLKNQYCSFKKCMQCHIGHAILKNE